MFYYFILFYILSLYYILYYFIFCCAYRLAFPIALRFKRGRNFFELSPPLLRLAEPQFVLGLPSDSWRKPLMLVVLFVVLLLSAAALYARCWLPVALAYRNKFGELEENGEFHIQRKRV